MARKTQENVIGDRKRYKGRFRRLRSERRRGFSRQPREHRKRSSLNFHQKLPFLSCHENHTLPLFDYPDLSTNQSPESGIARSGSYSVNWALKHSTFREPTVGFKPIRPARQNTRTPRPASSHWCFPLEGLATRREISEIPGIYGGEISAFPRLSPCLARLKHLRRPPRISDQLIRFHQVAMGRHP